MTCLRKRMIEDLQLRGMGILTQQNILATGSVLESILKPSESEENPGSQRPEVILCPHCGSTLRLLKTLRNARTRGPP
ncbi:MAG: hypothetical protein ABSG91_03450 [Syntrophobacteraceae bacterium]